MSRFVQQAPHWRWLPLVGRSSGGGRVQASDSELPPSHPGALRLPEQVSGLLPYPADVATLVKISYNVLAEHRTSGGAQEQPDGDQSILAAKEALIWWNTYLATGDEQYQSSFLAQATWILEHATAFAGGVFGWPVLSRVSTLSEPVPLLSASTQGLALSVLVRAYRLTGDEAFWQMAQGAVRAFEQDIFEGGVSAPIGAEGIFFEEIAAYPAAHHLSACLISLCGLSEYLAVAGDAQVAALVQRSLSTLSTLVAAFDTGYWSRADLSSRRLTAPAIHRLHVELLHALAQSSGDDAWAILAARWERYQHAFRSRLRYFLASTTGRLQRLFGRWIRQRFFRTAEEAAQERRRKVYVPITAFPVAGGMRSVLAGVAKAMAREWQMEYLTWHIGTHGEDMVVRSFGNTSTTYWQFPNVWLYVFAGWRRLLALLHQGQRHHLILSQDGVFTGAFAALAARLAGVPVVCMDHGSITLPYSRTYRTERLRALEHAPWRGRLLSRLRFACYWPSLRLLAWVATRTTDFFLAAGEDVEMAYRQQLGVSSGRIIRFPFLIDTDHYAPCDALVKAERREKLHLPADSIVITMINRLSPEKGVDIALRGMSRALEQLPGDVGARVRVIIAGDGPLRPQIEETIRSYHLESACLLWGEATTDDVALLLSISDLFLYTATRGINSAAVLEAMGAGLMVIASMEPRWMATLLAEGRGMAIPAGDAEAVGAALIAALTDLPRCRQMGTVAREYIKTHHDAESLRRCLLRATGWPLAVSAVHHVPREDSLMVARQSASFVADQGMSEEEDA